MKFIHYTLLIISFSLIASCGGEKEKKTEKESLKIGANKQETKRDSNSVNIGLIGNDMMRFDKQNLKVKAGQEVTLTLLHAGKMDMKIMGHNFVLLKQGVEITEFSIKAGAAGEDADWIPEGGKDVIAHTKMIGGGQSTAITFIAPKAGTYDFICSFPGHLGTMKGKFIVE